MREKTEMGFKANDSCLDKVGDDEPIFVLRAHDETAPEIVNAWVDNLLEAYRARALTPSEELLDKLAEARHCADLMRDWPTRKLPGQREKPVQGTDQ